MVYKIGDKVKFRIFNKSHKNKFEEEPYMITNIYNGENVPMYLIKNSKREFYTSEKALMLDLNFMATNDYPTTNNVFIKYDDGREEIVSNIEYFIRYSIKQNATQIKVNKQREKKKKIYEQLSLF